jgi:activator of 2-hydroxyglutaryl-CoA dehydratase/predicted nucleotide-binding protein (sugar kinase/HSP70/actin superfamily)
MSEMNDCIIAGNSFYIDAGVEQIHCCLRAEDPTVGDSIWSFPAGDLSEHSFAQLSVDTPVYITGKFSKIIKENLGRGQLLMPLAVLWAAAAKQAGEQGGSVVILNLSASGYALVGIDDRGELIDDLLTTNPRCGSGAGINIDRVLRKLDIQRSGVDAVLGQFLGEQGEAERRDIPVRADRCGVFASSATISDKNQGIPLSFALATTMKSEVLKACKHIDSVFDLVCLTGGIFEWQFARDCASDYFADLGCQRIIHDQDHGIAFPGFTKLIDQATVVPEEIIALQTTTANGGGKSLLAFPALRDKLEAAHLYKRQDELALPPAEKLVDLFAAGVFIGIDVGSTMAKIVIGSSSGDLLYRASYSNSGDTVETIKQVFADLRTRGIEDLNLCQIGITGSARYQIQKALTAIYPQLADRILVLVENYAHARGSLPEVRAYLEELESQGVKDLNHDFCVLVDVGGEDTKISTIDLERGDLYDNAMNTKCSAGTGSLLDTLVDLFRLNGVQDAVAQAMAAPQAESINATCAVFLLEHARRLQAEGRAQGSIIASAVWAIVENMARSLWPQIYLPSNTVVLLHGQTMQSDPMPLAISQRLQDFLDAPAYCLVPSIPGHRACHGLIQTCLDRSELEGSVPVCLSHFIDQSFERQIIHCRGAVCGDPKAHCYRSKLSATDSTGHPFSIALGGCSAVNELSNARSKSKGTIDSCSAIWKFQMDMLPTSDDAQRLVVPRSFAVSEWACFFSSLFDGCDIPVHVDIPTEGDVLRGQPSFRIDTCAPHIGVVGQLLRLAGEPHGMILAPQIEFLPVVGESLGRTCTINQGGFASGRGVAMAEYPDCRIHLFNVDLKHHDVKTLAHKLYQRLLPVYRYYQVDMPFARFAELVEQAMTKQLAFRRKTADYAAKLAREALDNGQQIALVMGREYVLNPGVYDSHVGRLLRDKGLVGIPSYVLNADCNPDLAHLYWRNAHLVASIAEGVAKHKLHEQIGHEQLKQIFAEVEKQEQLLPLVHVSTFLCGPDSVTNPLMNELIKERPFLRIQSDAAIKELAHLENRMNTYVNQLAAEGRQQIRFGNQQSFEVHLLDPLENRDPLDSAHDVICFPTLSDNRPLVAVFKSAGFTCLDNYGEDYNLQSLIERGRSIVGDGVCAPLAAVYGDVLAAITSFQQLKQNDPAFRDKKRLLIFNNKGLGPCRQGQYVEVHKLFLHQFNGIGDKLESLGDNLVQFLVSYEDSGYSNGFPRWIFLRGVQALILQGVMHQLQAEGSARCHSTKQLEDFMTAHKVLCDRMVHLIETLPLPPAAAAGAEGLKKLLFLPQSLASLWRDLFRHPIASELRNFSSQWCSEPLSDGIIKIHIDGEAYMRVAQYEQIHLALLNLLGPGRFHLTLTPLWGYLEYKLAWTMARAKETMSECRDELERGGDAAFTRGRKATISAKRKEYYRAKGLHLLLRKVMAGPFYRAAGLTLPEPVPQVLESAERVVATKRPGGELVPYLGEALLKLEKGYDLILNIAPEGCMVSSMGEVITPALYQAAPGYTGKIQPLFSQQGDIDEGKLGQAVLQALGPERLYL